MLKIKQMKNRITSAGTADEKRSKCSLLARLPLLLAIPMLAAVLYGCEIYSVVDTNKPMIVESKVDSNRYRIRYNDSAFFMEIITKDSLKIGDTLRWSDSR